MLRRFFVVALLAGIVGLSSTASTILATNTQPVSDGMLLATDNHDNGGG